MTEKSSDALPGDAELDPVLVAIGDRLRQARLLYGARLKPSRSVSQNEIGRLFDVTGVTVGAWEAGKNDAGVPMLYRLADYYGVRRVWLLTGEGEMFGDQQGGQGAKNGDTAPPRVGPAAPLIVEKTYPPELQPRPRKTTKRRPKRDDRTAVAM